MLDLAERACEFKGVLGWVALGGMDGLFWKRVKLEGGKRGGMVGGFEVHVQSVRCLLQW